MKTLIIGTGTIGIIYGWALSIAGIDVTHLVRSGRKQILEKSASVDILDSRKGYPKKQDTQYTPRCKENIQAEDNYELVILPLGIEKIEIALSELVATVPQALFLPFGTNWQGVQGINKYLSNDQYILGFPRGGGALQNDKGFYWLGNKVYLEEANGKREDNLNRLKLYFSRAGLKSTTFSNFEHFLWVSHATVMPFGPALVKAGSISALVNDRALLIQFYQAVHEIFELCRLRGANPGRFLEQSLLYRFPPWLFAPSTRLFLTLNEQFTRPVAYLGSKDGARQLKSLYGAIMNTASEFGHELPALKSLSDTWAKNE